MLASINQIENNNVRKRLLEQHKQLNTMQKVTNMKSQIQLLQMKSNLKSQMSGLNNRALLNKINALTNINQKANIEGEIALARRKQELKQVVNTASVSNRRKQLLRDEINAIKTDNDIAIVNTEVKEQLQKLTNWLSSKGELNNKQKAFMETHVLQFNASTNPELAKKIFMNSYDPDRNWKGNAPPHIEKAAAAKQLLYTYVPVEKLIKNYNTNNNGIRSVIGGKLGKPNINADTINMIKANTSNNNIFKKLKKVLRPVVTPDNIMNSMRNGTFKNEDIMKLNLNKFKNSENMEFVKNYITAVGYGLSAKTNPTESPFSASVSNPSVIRDTKAKKAIESLLKAHVKPEKVRAILVQGEAAKSILDAFNLRFPRSVSSEPNIGMRRRKLVPTRRVNLATTTRKNQKFSGLPKLGR